MADLEMIEEQYAKYNEKTRHLAEVVEQNEVFRLHKFHDLYKKKATNIGEELENGNTERP